jgi:hypothetical protein
VLFQLVLDQTVAAFAVNGSFLFMVWLTQALMSGTYGSLGWVGMCVDDAYVGV